MKNLVEFINESFVNEDIINDIKTVFKKVFSKGIKKFEENSKFLKDYVSNKRVIDEVKQSFDINRQAETGYVLGEYGGLVDLHGFVKTELLDLSDISKIKNYIKSSNSKEWKLTKVSSTNDCVWFVPALEAWGIDFDSIDEIDCITSYKEVYY
jgi:hypothetical protein